MLTSFSYGIRHGGREARLNFLRDMFDLSCKDKNLDSCVLLKFLQ